MDSVVTIMFSSMESSRSMANVDVSSRDIALVCDVEDRILIASTVVAAVSSREVVPRCETVISRGITLSSTVLLGVLSTKEGATVLLEITRLFLVAGDSVEASRFGFLGDFLGIPAIFHLPLTPGFSFRVLSLMEPPCAMREPLILVALVVFSLFLLSLTAEASFAFDLPE